MAFLEMRIYSKSLKQTTTVNILLHRLAKDILVSQQTVISADIVKGCSV